MNVVRLNEYISNNTDAIETILTNLGCENIKYNKRNNEFRCSREVGWNPSAVKINCETLKFICYSTNEQGSIYNFIMNKKNFSFPKALSWTAELLGLEKDSLNAEIHLPFGGFYKNIIKSINEPELNMKVYPINILDDFGYNTNLSFLRDGISLDIQEKFLLGYDHLSDRITIPQWNFNGELVGVMGRSNEMDIPYEYRWLPIIPCSRSYTLFGYHQNYAEIQQQQLAIITESEKGVMQMASMGFNYGLATCTKNISAVQERYIKALRVSKVILAYDQGVKEEELIEEAKKLVVDNPIYKNRVGYIYDRYGELLALDKKESPTDKGGNVFRELINKHTIWI